MEKQIQNILIEEEIYWKQRSRADWLKEGDKNTKFFHNKASSRKKKNRIWGIKDTSGRWTEKPKEIEQEFCSYFNNLFATTQPSQEQISAAMEGMTSRVSEDMNEMLEKPFSAEEVPNQGSGSGWIACSLLLKALANGQRWSPSYLPAHT